jgi:hypothetical protein
MGACHLADLSQETVTHAMAQPTDTETLAAGAMTAAMPTARITRRTWPGS